MTKPNGGAGASRPPRTQRLSSGRKLVLDILRDLEASKAVTALLARHPADHVTLEEPRGIVELLCVLRRIHDRQADGLSPRSRPEPRIMFLSTTKLAVARLTDELREAGASAAMKTLESRVSQALRQSGTPRIRPRKTGRPGCLIRKTAKRRMARPNRRSVRSHFETPAALRDDRWSRPSREIRRSERRRGLRLAPSGARQNGCYASMLAASPMI